MIVEPDKPVDLPHVGLLPQSTRAKDQDEMALQNMILTRRAQVFKELDQEQREQAAG